MRKAATLGLQVATVLIGAAVAGFLIWEPTVEGRNAQASLFQTYFTDPFLAYAYVGSIPFFVALYQAYRFWGYVGQEEGHSPGAAKALRVIKVCALALIAFVVGGEVILWLSLPPDEDRAGGVFMGGLVTLGAIAMVTAATVMERGLKRRVSRA